MSEKSNFISKGRVSLRKGFNKIRFSLFGASLALPAIIFSNCNGSCGGCYRCVASATPLVITGIILLSRKFRNLRKGNEGYKADNHLQTD